MKVIRERFLVKRKDSSGDGEMAVIRKRACRRTKRPFQHPPPPPPPPVTALQRLFSTCRGVFKGPGTVPHPHDVHALQFILDRIKPEDVGLSRDLLFFKANNVIKGTPNITNTTIYQCKNFSMCIFFLPPTGVIPLHNHPGMTVFSKLLLGSMHIKAYDLVDPKDDETPSSQLRLARLKVDSEFTAPCDTSVLYPNQGGNIHTFTARTACAILDILGPPYSSEDGRDCTYYRDFPYAPHSDVGAPDTETKERDSTFAWLEEIDIPKELKMDVVEYLGPQVNESC
ncbi:hypothetical protein QJS10_CPA08g00093 [Acorus calamus]|uniref:cysteine dioxygenase n=1 Tax=Acorus calamus TaxID=4465 RepID=A0AAV9EE63_ACOCL|nr:hypothetical protein QJS10_CPA08g00093 [Acorus calamus]